MELKEYHVKRLVSHDEIIGKAHDSREAIRSVAGINHLEDVVFIVNSMEDKYFQVAFDGELYRLSPDEF